MAKRKPPKAKAPDQKPKIGRPLLNIDPTIVEGMASIGCTKKEIALVLGCNEGTIHLRFSDVWEKGFSNLKMRLRKKQVELALGGNFTLLIWLGKQYLDQSEKQEIKQTTALRTFGPELVERARKALQALETEDNAAAANT